MLESEPPMATDLRSPVGQVRMRDTTQRTGAHHSSIMGGEQTLSKSPRKEKMYFKSLEKSMTF